MNQTPFVNPAQIEKARLRANMSYADLAFAIRRESDGRIKATEQSVRRWVKGLHAPRDGVVPAIAAATTQEIAFFYEADAEEDEDPHLLRDLQQLPLDLRRRIERALARAS